LKTSAVSKMLSHTADSAPRPRVERQDGSGSFSVRIIGAHNASARENNAPLTASGRTVRSARRTRAQEERGDPQCHGDEGERIGRLGVAALTKPSVPIAPFTMDATMPTHAQPISIGASPSFAIGAYLSCGSAARVPQTMIATALARYGGARHSRGRRVCGCFGSSVGRLRHLGVRAFAAKASS